MIITNIGKCKSMMSKAGWALFCRHRTEDSLAPFDPAQAADEEEVALTRVECLQYEYGMGREDETESNEERFKSFVLLKDFGFVPAGRILKQNVNGDYFISATDEEFLDGKLPWISVKLRRDYVENLPADLVARVRPEEVKVTVSITFDAPSLGLRTVTIYVTDVKGGVWQFPVHMNLKTGDVAIKDAMFASDDDSCFSEPGAVPVPKNIRMEMAKHFNEVIEALYP